MEDHDIQPKENEGNEEEPTGMNETDKETDTVLDDYADHNIMEATIFVSHKGKLLYIEFILLIIN